MNDVIQSVDGRAVRGLKLFGECVRDGADAGSLSVDVIRGSGVAKRQLSLLVRTRELPVGPQGEPTAVAGDGDVDGPGDGSGGNPLLASFLKARRSERAQEKLMGTESRSVGSGGTPPGTKKAPKVQPRLCVRERVLVLFVCVCARARACVYVGGGGGGLGLVVNVVLSPAPAADPDRPQSSYQHSPFFWGGGGWDSSTSTARTRSCGCPSRRPW